MTDPRVVVGSAGRQARSVARGLSVKVGRWRLTIVPLWSFSAVRQWRFTAVRRWWAGKRSRPGRGVIGLAPLLVREFWANRRRNAAIGSVLFIAVAVQLFTALSATASRTAVQTYGAAVYGFPETHSAALAKPLDHDELRVFNDRLAAIAQSYPWFRPATSVELSGYLRAGTEDDPAHAARLKLRAVSPSWRLLSGGIADDDAWRTVTSDRRLGAAALVESGTARRLGLGAPAAVTVLVEDASTSAPGSTPGTAAPATTAPATTAPATTAPATGAPGATPSAGSASGVAGSDSGGAVAATPGPGTPGSSGGSGTAASGAPSPAADPTAHRTAIRSVPVFGTFSELNTSLGADVLVNQNLLALSQAGPRAVQVYWRCTGVQCRDGYKLISTAAAVTGTKPGREQRLDRLDQFQPVLAQQNRDGDRYSVVVLVLGGLAVAIGSAAFVEVRGPRFAALRTLGASRLGVATIALLENVLTALAVGVVAVLLGFLATRLDPNRFNQIPQVRLDSLPWAVGPYAAAIGLALVIGLVAGLAPATRVYRSARI